MSSGNARIVDWPNPGNRCDIYACGKRAAYMVQHKQGLFGDRHFLLCQEDAEALVNNLPPELQKIAWSNQPPQAVLPMSTVEMILAVMASPEVRAIAEGKEAPVEVGKALGELLDMLAEGGTQVEAPTPEGSGPPPVITAEAAESMKRVAELTEQRRNVLTCPICGAGPFKSKAALQGHMNAKHGGGKK